MDFEFDLAIVIGRLQGPTKGHAKVLRAARKKARKVVLLLGSANLARDTRGPWTYTERTAMIYDMISDMAREDAGPDATDEWVASHIRDWLEAFTIQPLNDTGPFGKNEWISQVQNVARNATKAVRPRVTLVGNIRDATSEYLTWFPKWPFTPVQDDGINATAVRKAYFAGGVNFHATGWTDGLNWSDVLYPSTIEALERFRGKPEYAYLMEQKKAEDAYAERWGPGPFLATDAVIECAGHVARIERGGLEGFGMKALPGGFFKAGRGTIWNAAQEAVEETAIFIPEYDLPTFDGWLAACNKAFKEKLSEPKMPDFVTRAIEHLITFVVGTPEIFDDPHRSRRAHIVSHAVHFRLPPPALGTALPRLRGSDDARAADWDPISEIEPVNTFEDHAWIVDRMLSLNA